MALFKPFRGTRSTLPTELRDGYTYFCTDDGSFHIDYTDADGNLQRKQISANNAEMLGGLSLDEIKKTIIDETIPSVTTADNGKFLRVVNGAWAAATVPSVEEVSY